jgi:hypothetical protein
MSNIKPLEGWVSVATAASILGMSRQAVHSRIGRGSFEKVASVSTGEASRPFYLLDEAEVQALAEQLNPASV